MRLALTKLAAAVAIAAAEAVAEDRPDRIVVSIPDRKMVVLSGDRVMKIYDVAVGAAWTPSPEGEFRIINRIPNPAWYTTGKVVAPGKGNPLGSRWMGLSAKGYGIHGTNAPKSIGKAASHGCIRMRKEDLEELFELVSVGVVVEICGERVTE
jgi:lipoprotein-anchoring transpeptidase ErfK/SrfK